MQRAPQYTVLTFEGELHVLVSVNIRGPLLLIYLQQAVCYSKRELLWLFTGSRSLQVFSIHSLVHTRGGGSVSWKGRHSLL